MMFIMAIIVVVSCPADRQPTGTLHAHAKILQPIERSVPSTISMAGVPIIPM